MFMISEIFKGRNRIFHLSNLGTLIFFILNITLIYSVFGTMAGSSYPLLFYILTVVISLSPIGEEFLCIVAGAQNIKRTDMKVHVIPLVEVVLDAAKEKSQYHLEKIHVKVIRDDKPNAFALGRRTLAVTEGLLQLPDEIVMAVIAHEIGHLAYGHTVIQLLIGGGNVFISGCLFIIKIACWAFTIIMGIVSAASRSGIMGIITAVFAGISFGVMWIWVKFCSLFLMWSRRQNELQRTNMLQNWDWI